MTQFDTIVIGAGPAGSTVARLLAKAGQSVALVEKAEFPRRKVCGEYISAATLPLLDACGIGREFMEMAGPKVSRVAFFAGNKSVDAPLPSGGGRALGREHLDTLLRDAAVAAGATLYQPAELNSLQRIGGVHVAQVGNVLIEGRTLIGASGSWSVKGPFALNRRPRTHDLLAFKAHFHGGHLPDGLMPLLAFPGGYGGMVATDGGRTSLSCCIRRDVMAVARAHYGGRAGEAVLAHIMATTRAAARALDGAVPDGAYLSAGPIRPGIRARYHEGMFFTGNLAGEAHPVIAEGISMAIQSSALLARILIAEPDADIAGARYRREWLRAFAPRLQASKIFAHMAMHDATRAIAASAVTLMPSLLTLCAKLAGKAA